MRYFRLPNSTMEYRVDENKVSYRDSIWDEWSNELEIDFDAHMAWLVEEGVLVEIQEYNCSNDQ